MLGIVLAFAVGLFMPDMILLAKGLLLYYKLKKAATPRRAKPTDTCRGPHSWLTTGLVREDGQNSGICRICGLIKDTNLMVSQEEIDSLEREVKMNEIETKLFTDFLKREDEDIKAYFSKELANGVDFGKLTKLHNAGITFNDRYAMYRAAKNKEVQKELRKGDS